MTDNLDYIARCPCGCGAVRVWIANDYPVKEKAKEIARLIRAGYEIERMTTREVRGCCSSCQRTKNVTENGVVRQEAMKL